MSTHNDLWFLTSLRSFSFVFTHTPHFTQTRACKIGADTVRKVAQKAGLLLSNSRLSF